MYGIVMCVVGRAIGECFWFGLDVGGMWLGRRMDRI